MGHRAGQEGGVSREVHTPRVLHCRSRVNCRTTPRASFRRLSHNARICWLTSVTLCTFASAALRLIKRCLS